MKPQALLDRLLAAIPATLGALAVLALVYWQSSQRKTPTIFTDELKWAQLSRAIASTGRAAQRGAPVSFGSLYSYVLAPVWWIHSTETAFSVAKYLDTTLMCLTAVPVYLIARLLVSRRAATIAALGSICTSAMFYAGFLLPETVAYPFFAVSAYASIRALAGGGRRWNIAAVALALVAIVVRSELIVAGAALATAAAVLWVVGPRGRRFRSGWTRFDHVGAAILLIGLFTVVNRILSPHAVVWTVVTQTYQGRMWSLGLNAVSALAIGLGIVPLVGGLASLWLPERRHEPAWRAFAAYTASAIVFVWLYTGVKAAYLSLTTFTRIEERNLIYLGPLLIVGTVVYFTARRPWLPGTIAAFVVTAWLVLHYGYQLDYPYFESPGYGVASLANRDWHWTQHDIRIGLAVACAVTAVLLALPWLRTRGRRLVDAALLLTAAATITWMLAGEITSANGAASGAKATYDHLPKPVDWVDREAGSGGVTFLGQNLSLGQDLGVNLVEFWNRSVKNIWSLDGSAPGPGRVLTPDLRSRNGRLSNDPELDYVLEANGVSMIGPTVAARPGVTLVRIPSHPWRLREATYGVSDDGWVAAGGGDATSASARYAYFGPGTARGTLEVDVSRAGFCHQSPGTNAVVRVGPVALDQQRAPIVVRPTAVRHVHVADCSIQRLSFPARPPVAVQVTVSPLARGTDFGLSDARLFGAQVGFAFKPVNS